MRIKFFTGMEKETWKQVELYPPTGPSAAVSKLIMQIASTLSPKRIRSFFLYQYAYRIPNDCLIKIHAVRDILEKDDLHRIKLFIEGDRIEALKHYLDYLTNKEAHTTEGHSLDPS